MPYPNRAAVQICENMVQILLVLQVHVSEVEDLFCRAPSGPELAGLVVSQKCITAIYMSDILSQ